MAADVPSRPQRRSLPHDVPRWIDPAQEVYFITVNCAVRGTNTLCNQTQAAAIFDSVAARHSSRAWHCSLCLLMPDHLHALISFVDRERTMQKTMAAWKRWLANEHGFQWQTNYFEHRVRSEHEEVWKAQYILNNPVRKGLVGRWEEWPYVWRPGLGE